MFSSRFEFQIELKASIAEKYKDNAKVITKFAVEYEAISVASLRNRTKKVYVLCQTALQENDKVFLCKPKKIKPKQVNFLYLSCKEAQRKNFIIFF